MIVVFARIRIDYLTYTHTQHSHVCSPINMLLRDEEIEKLKPKNKLTKKCTT